MMKRKNYNTFPWAKMAEPVLAMASVVGLGPSVETCNNPLTTSTRTLIFLVKLYYIPLGIALP